MKKKVFWKNLGSNMAVFEIQYGFVLKPHQSASWILLGTRWGREVGLILI